MANRCCCVVLLEEGPWFPQTVATAVWVTVATAPAPRVPPSLRSAMALQMLLAQLFGGDAPKQDLDFVEAFAGDAAVSQGLRLLGYRGESFDARYHPDFDVLTPRGFLTLLSFVARLRPGGLFWAAPPCSSWVFLSLSTTKRNDDVRGDPSNFRVQSQNALVERILLLSAFAQSRGAFFYLGATLKLPDV